MRHLADASAIHLVTLRGRSQSDRSSGRFVDADPSKAVAIRGPHARLAIRLQRRDPGREFVLGQRIQYVLLPGERLQVRIP